MPSINPNAKGDKKDLQEEGERKRKEREERENGHPHGASRN